MKNNNSAISTGMEAIQGYSRPWGLSKTKEGWNVAVFSERAAQMFLGVFLDHSQRPVREFPMQRTGASWHLGLRDVPQGASYAVRAIGASPALPGDHFDPSLWLLDPFARFPTASRLWGTPTPSLRARFAEMPDFDWQGIKKPRIPKQDLILYEMHVRGFTASPSSGVRHPGTYQGMIEKIPYLKQLGVNAVELMPLFEFDETHCPNVDPARRAGLLNYWGYSPVSFFAPKASYAADPLKPIQEFRTLVRELHRNGIEVILDVVYNHTGEGKSDEPTFSWRGLDNRGYYFVDSAGHYLNFSCCGNAINGNTQPAQELILESLRFWAREMGVDGFRLDLASILTRGMDGAPLDPAPLITAMTRDPDLADVKWIAEPWDAVGLYQVGSFPKWGPWSEWNGRYRDIVRRFIKGVPSHAGLFATVLCGSDFLYRGSGTPLSSVNFVTAHDGFTLRDLVSFHHKHNQNNGEHNRDGCNENDSWNCGAEGTTADPKILELRERQMANFFLALLLSQGIPMLLMGDEYGHTRHGNNNAYLHDTELNWFLWEEADRSPFVPFVRGVLLFRSRHPELRMGRFLTEQDITWHGTQPHQPDWSPSAKLVAFSIGSLYVAFYAGSSPLEIVLPDNSYSLVCNTSDWRRAFFEGKGPPLPQRFLLAPHSTLIGIHTNCEK
jgi:isoamylase/glycogen operon protein